MLTILIHKQVHVKCVCETFDTPSDAKLLTSIIHKGDNFIGVSLFLFSQSHKHIL